MTEATLWNDIVKQGKLGAYTGYGLHQAEKTKSKLIRTEILLFVGVVVSLLLWLGLHMLTIYLQFKPMIQFIDSGRKQGNSEYYTTSSGFAVAFYYLYPHLDWFSHFRNDGWPSAMVWAYYTTAWGNIMRSDVRNVQKLYLEMDQGNQSGEDSVKAAICSWLKKINQPTESCEKVCKTFYQPGIPDLIGGGMSGAMMGAFAGHAIGGAATAAGASIPGIGIGVAAASAAASIGISLWRGFSNQKKCQQQQDCLDKKCSLVNF